MPRARLGLKAVGLCAFLVGAMAIGVTGVANAETGACWGYINPSNAKLECFTSSLEASSVFSVENKVGTLLIANQTIEILCGDMAFDENGQLTANGSVLLGRVKFSNCITFLKKVLSPPCTPNDPVSGLGTILTEKITGLIVLHKLADGVSDSVVEFKPDSGDALVDIHLGAECAFAELLLVKGKFVAVDSGGKSSFEEHKVTHLFEEFKALQLMKVGVNKATIDGSAEVKLGGAHLGFKWSGKAS